MSWIKILYPKPSFYISPWLGKFRHVHRGALTVVYYLTQTLVLLALTGVYFCIVVPLKIRWKMVRKDPLRSQWNTEKPSYFIESSNVKQIDFKRMY